MLLRRLDIARELYNIREPSEHRLLLRDIIELSVPFAAECDNWSSIYYGILEGSVPTLQSMFTEPNPPEAIRDAAEVAVACGNSEWLRDCRARLRDSDWGDEGNEFACMVLEDLPSSLG